MVVGRESFRLIRNLDAPRNYLYPIPALKAKDTAQTKSHQMELRKSLWIILFGADKLSPAPKWFPNSITQPLVINLYYHGLGEVAAILAFYVNSCFIDFSAR